MAESPTSTDRPSRLLEALRRAGREESGALGFGQRPPARRRAPLVLIAALPEASAAYLAAAREAGVDAALVPAGGVEPADLDRWRGGGADAVVLRPQGAIAACFSPRRRGLFAQLDRGLEPERLRAATALPVDGFVLDAGGRDARLSGDELLWITLAAGLARGPAVLLAEGIVAEDLEALLGAGLSGIAERFAPGAGVASVQGKLTELRAAVDALDPHLRREARQRGEGPPVVLPPRGPGADDG
jgi:hypothetical protein